MRLEAERKATEEAEAERSRFEAEWRHLSGLKEKEALATQQTALAEANAAMHSQQNQQQQYTALLARLPKFEGMKPSSYPWRSS